MEEPGNYHAPRDFEFTRDGKLTLKNSAQLAGQRKLAAFSALRLIRLKL
jgi:hypothetical protein